MSIFARTTGSTAVQTVEDALRVQVCVASRCIGVLVALALCGQLLAAIRLDALATAAYPALLDAHDLAAAVAAVHHEIANGGDGPAHRARLDSLANRVHAATRHGATPRGALAEARVAAYLERVGSAAQVDAEPLPAGEAAAAYDALVSVLGRQTAGAERSVQEELASMRLFQSMAATTLVVAAVLGLYLLTLMSRRALDTYSSWGHEVAQTLTAMTGSRDAGLPREAQVTVAHQIQAAIARLSREAAANVATARALADGAYHRAARAHLPQDEVGVALASLTGRLNDLAASASRIARGDLSRAVEPLSSSDTFGQAYAGMTKRIIATVRDAESSRVKISATILAMRGDAAALASSTTEDARRLRRTEERLAAAALQARAGASRGALAIERALDSEAMLDDGAVEMHASLDGLADVLRRSADVQRLARNAGLLAARMTGEQVAVEAETPGHASDARALVTDAGRTAAAITQVIIDGTERSYRAGVAVDRVALATRDSTALVRELGSASHRQALALREIDDTVAHVHRTTARGADTARHLLQRLDALSSQARGLEVVLRGAARSGEAAISTARRVASPARRAVRGLAVQGMAG